MGASGVHFSVVRTFVSSTEQQIEREGRAAYSIPVSLRVKTWNLETASHLEPCHVMVTRNPFL